jgi:hypothetical protein
MKCLPTPDLEEAIASELNNVDIEGEAFEELVAHYEITKRLHRGTDISPTESSPEQVCKEI